MKFNELKTTIEYMYSLAYAKFNDNVILLYSAGDKVNETINKLIDTSYLLNLISSKESITLRNFNTEQKVSNINLYVSLHE